MIIYALEPDRSNKKRFVMSDDYPLQKIRDFDTGEKKADNWNPPSIRWFGDDGRDLSKYKDPDISYIHPGSFIVNQHTHNLIAHAIGDVAELLPIPFNNETWYLLNVHNQVDAMDKANSHYKIYRSGKVGWLIKPAFFTDRVPQNKLFKIPEDPASIYYAECQSDGDKNNFVRIIEKNNLFGVEFQKVQEKNKIIPDI